MRRREFITLACGAAAAWPLAAYAQQGMPVIGYLNAAAPDGYSDPLRAFRDGLKESGYVEGSTVAIDYRWADNQPGRLAVLADELVRRPVNVLAAVSAPAAVATAKATTTIPTVFMVPEDPVRLGLVSSLARPGGNATGVNFFAAELAAKRLELLRALVPEAKQVAVLLNPAEPTIEAANRRDVEAAAAAMGLQLRIINAGTIAEVDAAFGALASERPDALFVSSGPFFANRSVQLAQLAARHAIPAIGEQPPLFGSRRADHLRSEPDRCASPGRRLHRPHSQGCQASRPAGGAVDQVRAGHQSQRQALGINVPPDAARHRRRGDRVAHFFHARCCTCSGLLLALRSYAENDAQRPLLEVKADSHVAVR